MIAIWRILPIKIPYCLVTGSVCGSCLPSVQKSMTVYETTSKALLVPALWFLVVLLGGGMAQAVTGALSIQHLLFLP